MMAGGLRVASVRRIPVPNRVEMTERLPNCVHSLQPLGAKTPKELGRESQ